MDCFGTYFTHVQTCDNVRVQSATQWNASIHTFHMSKPVITFVFKVLRNGLLRHIYFTHVQPCDDVRVQIATQWTASVHTLHMSKPVITFVCKVLSNGLLRYILYTCPNLCDNVRVQSATQWTASVHTLHMSKPVIAFVFKVLPNGLLRQPFPRTICCEIKSPGQKLQSSYWRCGQCLIGSYTQRIDTEKCIDSYQRHSQIQQ